MASSSDPFDTVNVLNIPDFKYENETQWRGFHFGKELKSEIFSIPDVEHKALQNLQPCTFTLDVEEVPIPSLEASSASSYTTAEDDPNREIEHSDKDSEPFENVWTFAEVKDSSRHLKLTSWDHFTNGQHIEPGTAYLSEAGASTFDAIIASLDAPNKVAPLVITDSFLHALLELGLGRSSVLFKWSEEQQHFDQNIDDFTVSGCTAGLVQHIVESTAAFGTMMRKLSEARRYYHRDELSQSPSVLGFHAALSSCLTAIQQHMDSQRYDIITVLHFQQVYSEVVPLLGLLDRVATLVKNADGDCSLSSSLLGMATSLSTQYPQFGPVLNQIISFVAKPILEELSCDIGLSTQHCLTRKEARVDDTDRWENVLSMDILQTVKEAAHALQLLQIGSSGQLSALLPSITNVEFDLAFSWASVIAVQTEADDYESGLKSHLLILDTNHGDEVQKLAAATGSAFSHGVVTDRENAFALLDIEKSRPSLGAPHPASVLVLECLNHATSCSELSLNYDEVMAQSISPLLFAQHRLLSYSILELLFTEHRLLSHLTLQHRIHLLGDGMFAARLSIALFDSEQSSGEGRRRTGATTGLRLQTRDTWPPASSELRLVLMGVLSESMSVSGTKALEDTVSFAIRELSEEEMEKCRDVDSIHALDFLKLQYRPPSLIVEAVISGESLEKYDRIFQHLLRVLRLKSVAQGLLRESSSRRAPVHDGANQKFLIEIQCFVSAVADCCQNVAANRPWTSFENIIRDIRRKLEMKDYEGVLAMGQSLENLKRQHEETLDSILRALLLKRRQKQALEVLESIFGVILEYAAAARKMTITAETTIRYREDFRGLVRRFVGLLQELGRSKELKGSNGDGDNFAEEMLLKLDYNGYWSR